MLELALWPAPILKKKTKEVDMLDPEAKEEIKFLSDQMFKTMHKHKGIGLAAPQVHLDKRLIVMDCVGPLVVVNPSIVETSKKYSRMAEGCLSFPGFLVDVERPTEAVVKYQDLLGTWQTEKFIGLEARCIQHEIDHLDGITFLRYISSFHRKMIEKKMEKRRG